MPSARMLVAGMLLEVDILQPSCTAVVTALPLCCVSWWGRLRSSDTRCGACTSALAAAAGSTEAPQLPQFGCLVVWCGALLAQQGATFSEQSWFVVGCACQRVGYAGMVSCACVKDLCLSPCSCVSCDNGWHYVQLTASQWLGW